MATRCDKVRRAGAVALPPLPLLLGPVQVAELYACCQVTTENQSRTRGFAPLPSRTSARRTDLVVERSICGWTYTVAYTVL